MSKSIDEMYGRLAEVWGHCDDVRFRWVQVGNRRGFVVWIYALIGKELAQEGLLEPLATWDGPDISLDGLERVLQTVSLNTVKTVKEINAAIGNGQAVLCVDG
ncbi:spore germination protein, partial [Kyrpidia sp.]|uniref:spore germination protein n=1 Tax=Kyrpidia sp. TaxID=2073077 RepID=UPI0025841C83